MAWWVIVLLAVGGFLGVGAVVFVWACFAVDAELSRQEHRDEYDV